MAKSKIKIEKADLEISDDVKKKLSSLRKESEEEAASKLAEALNLRYIDLNIFPIDTENIGLIPEEKAKKHKVLLFLKQEKMAKLAVVDPQDEELKNFVEEWKKAEGMQVEWYVVSQSSLERGLEYYNRRSITEAFDYLRMKLSGDDLEEFESQLRGIADIGKRINEVPVTEVLNMIFAGAIKMGASDIHFEPRQDEKVRLRYRIDGVLQNIADFPINSYHTIVSRIKVMSGMRVNIRENAQDGRFSIKVDEKNEMDVRVSVLPGNHGENIVVRMLNQDIAALDIDKIGLEGMNYEWLISESDKKQGMIVNSGPTGSGKTTTLYALINRINTPDKKIISIEDPIEYQVAGVSQTQVETGKGYTFSSGLRSIVRQDPDVILVGEIRDDETADIATHAALTGHLVLTTIHSKSGAGVASRLIDLGVKPALITSAINAFIAQRLLRKLCPFCKERYVPAQETVDTLKKMLSLISPKSKVEIPKEIKYLWRPKGCGKCQGLGYKGRTGIFEVLVLSDEVKAMIEEMADEDKIRAAALENGMITYEQDGVLKAIKGETSLEELQRVTGKGDYLLEMYEKIVIQSLSQGILIEKETLDKVEKIYKEPEKLKEVLKESSLRDFIKYLLTSAIFTRAGDVHIEPGEGNFKIRFRIDGILRDMVELPMTEFLNLLNEIKNLSGFKVQARQGVMDGRFRIVLPEEGGEKLKGLAEKKVDVRVSIILGGFGDIVVMRLLNQSAQATELEKLKLHPYNLKRLKNNIHKPNGLVLNTGPTGSGKTTTLYSALAYLNKPELKIITVEDPIEYQMNGVIQTQVKESENYTFASALRALMRQNPDIIMVGEIRDEETAQIAYQAALTGHLVLSTLHTNSAAGSVQRLVNMGLSLSDLAVGTNCFMAQRLIRTLCPHCKKEVKPKEEERAILEELFETISPLTGVKAPKKISTIYQPVGCAKCQNIGYWGRTPLGEILEVEEEMEKFVLTGPSTSQLQKKALELGMLSMAQNGALRILTGETSFAEVARVTREVEREEEMVSRDNKKTSSQEEVEESEAEPVANL